ncbi:MAG: MFS transporter [Mailhella sp.]|nr:MFS transporter [Mailhella sp.]
MQFSASSRSLTALIYLLAFLGAMGNPIVLPTLPFLMEDLHISPLQMGMMISLYALPGALILPFYGVISDRLGRRRLLLASLGLCVLGSMLCAFAPDFSTLLAGRAMQGLSITPLDSMSFTLATDLFEGKKRMTLVERCSTVQFFCVTIVPLSLSAIIPHWGWRSAFVFAGLLSFAALLLSLPVQVPYRPSNAQKFRAFLSHLACLLISQRLLLLFAVRILVAVMIFGVIYPHLPLLMVQKLSYPPELVGLMFSLYALGMFLGSLVVPCLSRRFNEIAFGFSGGVFLLASVLLLAYAGSLWLIGLGLLCVGMGSGILIPQNTAHVSLAATEDTHGSVMSAYSTIFRLGQAIAPGIMGVLYAWGSFTLLFSLAAFLAVFTGLISAVAFSYSHRLEHL